MLGGSWLARFRAGSGGARPSEAGSVSLELVMLVPVLTLLTLFVLWAGRGGRVALTADLAAEEAATAAALCCEEDDEGGADREALVEDMLAARPGLEHLCVGGLRPGASPDNPGGPVQLVEERWLDFEPGRATGGVGVLGVRFECETDGAVAPLQGLLPPVTFQGQATEVVLRQPLPSAIGFEGEPTVVEGRTMVFELFSGTPVPYDVRVDYTVRDISRGATEGEDYVAPSFTVTIPQGHDRAQIEVETIDDILYEGSEWLVLELTDLYDTETPPNVPHETEAVLDPDRRVAAGEIEDNDPKPHLFVSFVDAPCEVDEGHTTTFQVRLRDEHNTLSAPSATTITVDIGTATTGTGDGHAVPGDKTGDDYRPQIYGHPVTHDSSGAPNNPMTSLIFTPGEHTHTVTAATVDDLETPKGEPDETFKVVLANPTGARVGHDPPETRCTIIDDEVEIRVEPARIDEDDGTLTFDVWFTDSDKPLDGDIELKFDALERGPAFYVGSDQAPATPRRSCGDSGADYQQLDDTNATIHVRSDHDVRDPVKVQVTLCGDRVVERDETFWLHVERGGFGEVDIPEKHGAVGTILNDDFPAITVEDPTCVNGVDSAGEACDEWTRQEPFKPLADDSTQDPDDRVVTFRVNLGGSCSGAAQATEGDCTGAGGTWNSPAEVAETVRVDYAIEPVPATEGSDEPVPATEGSDYASPGSCSDQDHTTETACTSAGETWTPLSGTLTFGACSDPTHTTQRSCQDPATWNGTATAQDVPVVLLPDYVTEDNETFELRLNYAVGGIPPSALADGDDPPAEVVATATITDNPPPVLTVTVTEGTRDSVPEGDPLSFTVKLLFPRSDPTVEVDWAATTHQAVAGTDFDIAGGRLTLGKLTAATDVEVTTLNDTNNEADETMHLVLSNAVATRSSGEVIPGGVTIGGPGVGTIVNVNGVVVLADEPPVDEGGDLEFTISIIDADGNPADADDFTQNITVNYWTENLTAKGGTSCGVDKTDYITQSGSHTFKPGDATTHMKTVDVRTCGDLFDEDDETVLLVLELEEGTRHAAVGDFGVGTINDASDPPIIRIVDADAQEGDPLRFEVKLMARDGDDLIEAPSFQPVSVTVVTGDGTATAPGDYTALPAQTRTIPAGVASIRLEVDTNLDDLDDEGLETLYVGLSSPIPINAAKIDKAFAVGTIHPRCVDTGIDDEDNRPPTLIVPAQTISERDHYEVKVRFSRPICTPVYVQWDEESGEISGETLGTMTAKYEDPPDWDTDLLILRTGTLERPLHEAYVYDHNDGYGGSGPFTLAWSRSLRDDSLDEDNEWFTVRARWGPNMPSHYQGLGWVTGRVTVIDDDPPPGLRVQDASAEEGSAMSFTVSLDARSGKTVTVEYRTADRSGTDAATAGSDYTAVPWARLTIAPGETSATFTVNTSTDSDDDNGETFLVRLRAPESLDPDDPAPAMNAQIVDGVAVGTILEGDPPVLSIADNSGDEGWPMKFTITLDGTVTEEATVKVRTQNMPSGATAAVAGSDYTARPSRTLTIPADSSDSTWTVSVPILTDRLDEPDETFLVQLHDPSGISLDDPSAVGTINGNVECYNAFDYSSWNAQNSPDITADNPTVDEGAGTMTVTLTISEPYCADNKLEMYHKIRGTAAVREDFNLPVSEIWFDALETTTAFSLEVIDDERVELDETVVIKFTSDGTGRYPWQLRGPSTRSRVDVTGTITDNDESSLHVTDASGDEGDPLTFTLTLDKAVHSDVTVDYATADGTATAGADYTAAVGGTATIPAGRFTTTVSVDTTQDSLAEGDETFELRLTNPVGTTVPAGEEAATGTVRDDDLPSVQISNAGGDEGDALTFTVSIDMAAAQDITVGYATRDGTAVAGEDYTAAPADASVTIPTGDTSATFTVATLADADAESAERFFVDVEASGAAYRIDDGLGVGAIRDVSRRALTVSDAYAVEGGTLGFKVGFDGPPVDSDITVSYRTVAGTAAAGDDYSDDFESAARTLRIVAGSSAATVSVATVQDTLDEDAERLELVLSDPGDGAVLAPAGSRARGVIIDDDPEPEVSVGDAEATENGDGVPVSFTVSLSEASGREVSVPYSTVDASAQAGDDYVAAAPDARVTVPVGDTTAVIEVALVNDDDAEEVERFLLELSSPTGARTGDGIGAGTILDDDGAAKILVDDAAEAYEGPDAAAVFEVRLSRPAEAEVTVNYATADATATAGADYTAESGTLTFAAGVTTTTVSVDLVDDDDEEITETFRLELTEPSSNARLGDDPLTASAVIVDDDGVPEMSVLDTSGVEGAGAVFEVRLSAPSSKDVTVDYAAVRDPTAAQVAAAPAQDFTPVTGTLTIPARSLSATLTVQLPDDSLDEHAERFWLRLSNPAGATLADGTATGTVIDNDPLPRLSIGDSAAAEGDNVTFTVLLAPVSGRTVTVPWATAVSSADHPASPTVDYTSASGTLTFAAGATSAQISIATVDDDEPEDDETFLVSLDPPTNAALGDAVAVGTIRDDDALPRITITDARPVREGSGPAVFTVRLNRSSTEVVTVDYATSDGTAAAGDDYDAAEGSLSIPVGLTTGEISVAVVDDDITEVAETFDVTLSNPGNAVIAEGAATATIRDNEQPNITIASARASEGDGTIDFSVTLDQAGDEAVTVAYATFDGTAVQPDDYTAAAGTLTIAAGDTAATVSVTLTDDTFTEDTETFVMRLSAAAGARIATAEAVGTVTDDDNLPFIRGRTEADNIAENQGPVSIRYFLDRASDVEVSFNYSIRQASRGNYPPSARCPWLIEAAARTGTLTFRPGSTEVELRLTIIDNDVRCGSRVTQWDPDGLKSDELTFVLSEPVNAVIQPDEERSALIVWDDEHQPDLEVVNGYAWEGSGEATLVVRATHAYTSDITVDYEFESYGDFNEATPGEDYTGTLWTPETLTIRAGETEAAIPIPIIDDDEAEGYELVWVYLSSPVNADITTCCGSLRILDNDAAAQLSVGDVRVAEGAGAAEFTIVLDPVLDGAVTVNYATADGTATQPSDYEAASGSVTISAGDSVATVRVRLVDDSDEEGDETFTLTLSGASGATISDDGATATATIFDDEALPIITVADLAVTESNPGPDFGLPLHPVTLSRASQQTVSVDWRIVPVPSLGHQAALPDVDYRVYSRSGTVTFSPDETYLTFRAVRLIPDLIPEHDKKFLVVLSDPVNAVLGNTRAWVTILDDDLPIATVADVEASESARLMTFTVALHAAAVVPGTLDYATSVRSSAGTAAATPDEDYTGTTGTLSIPVGAQSATFTVPITGDSRDEADETFLVTLSNPVNVAVTDPIAVGTIIDDDPGWTIDDRSVWENNADPPVMDFTVTRDHTSGGPVTVSYRISATGSAVGGAACTDGVDYITPSGSVTLQAADTTATIRIRLCDDTDVEGRETLLVELTGVPGRKLTGTGTIISDD